MLIILAFRKSPHPTKIAMLFPRADVDTAFTIERGDELIAIPFGALGELLGPSKIERDAFETARQSCHRLTPVSVIMVVILPRSGKGSWIEEVTRHVDLIARRDMRGLAFFVVAGLITGRRVYRSCGHIRSAGMAGPNGGEATV